MSQSQLLLITFLFITLNRLTGSTLSKLSSFYNLKHKLVVDCTPTGIKLFDSTQKCIELVDNDNKLMLNDLSKGINFCDYDARSYLGMYGVLKMPMGYYLALISSSEPVACSTIPDLHTIRGLDFVRIPTKQILFSEKISHQQREAEHLLIGTLQRHSFVFSTGQYDVTKRLQDNLIDTHRDNTLQYDDRFFWNLNCTKIFLNNGLCSFVTPVTNAYITSNEIQCADNKRYQLTLISRRNRYRQGPRYIKRGCDESGNVANFVETEQIIQSDDDKSLSSFVQIRGSIPLIWQQPSSVWKRKAVPKLLTQDLLSHVKVLKLHLCELIRRYSQNRGGYSREASIYFINLIDKVSMQGALGSWLYKAFKGLKISSNVNPIALESDKLILKRDETLSVDFQCSRIDGSFLARYIWFDYHHKCKDGNIKSFEDAILPLVSPALDVNSGGFFTIQYDQPFNTSGMSNSNDQMRLQNKIIRTNCMDCLDRTNVVQAIISKWVLGRQISSLGRKQFNNAILTENANNILRHMWSKHGDHLSYMYAGSRAMKREVTKSGKQTYRGKLSDGVAFVQRYVTNNYLDKQRQRGLDYLLGNSDAYGERLFTASITDDCINCNSTTGVSNYSNGFTVSL